MSKKIVETILNSKEAEELKINKVDLDSIEPEALKVDLDSSTALAWCLVDDLLKKDSSFKETETFVDVEDQLFEVAVKRVDQINRTFKHLNKVDEAIKNLPMWGSIPKSLVKASDHNGSLDFFETSRVMRVPHGLLVNGDFVSVGEDYFHSKYQSYDNCAISI